MKKHSKKEEINLDDLDFITQQGLDFKLNYESVFKSDKKTELLKELMKVDFSSLDRRKVDSSDLEVLGVHKKTFADESLLSRKLDTSSENSKSEVDDFTDTYREKRRSKPETNKPKNSLDKDLDEVIYKISTEQKVREHSKNNRRESFAEIIKESFDNRDQSLSSLLGTPEKLKHFNDLNYEVFDFQNIKSRIKKYGVAIRQSSKLEEATDALEKIFEIWKNFQEYLSIATVRQFSNSFTKINYKYEYEARLVSCSEIRKEIFKASVALLDKNFLPELIKENGKLFFYKLNKFNLLNSVQNKGYKLNLIDLENEFIEYLNTSDISEFSNKFVDLAIKRTNIVRNIGFKDYFDYIKVVNLDFYQSFDSLKGAISNIKKYILPIHSIEFEHMVNKFSEENENMLSDFYIDMDQDEFAQYYKNIFGEFDWELRNLNDVFAYINENRIHQKFFPQTDLANTNLKDKQLIEALFHVSNRAIDRQSRGYLETLADSGYINLNTTKTIDNQNNFLGSLPESKLFCMNLSINNSMKSISDFLYLSGNAYSQLLRFKTKSNINISTIPTAESQHFIGTTMEMMTISRLNMLFDEDNARKFRDWRVHMLLFHVINKCFLFDFELHFYELLADVMDSPIIDEKEYRLILDMLEKKTSELWDNLLKEYRLSHYYQDKDFFRKNTGKYLIQEPFTGLKMASAELASVFIMLEFEDDRAKARYDFEKFCAISGQSLFEEELNLAGIDNPIELDNLKSLAFAIVDKIETLEIEESDSKK